MSGSWAVVVALLGVALAATAAAPDVPGPQAGGVTLSPGADYAAAQAMGVVEPWRGDPRGSVALHVATIAGAHVAVDELLAVRTDAGHEGVLFVPVGRLAVEGAGPSVLRLLVWTGDGAPGAPTDPSVCASLDLVASTVSGSCPAGVLRVAFQATVPEDGHVVGTVSLRAIAVGA